ncbi:MAG: hypothetical protein NTW38_10140 [Candidatus Aminicenantes bacterium]|nr:hypothetical protein [Candidatus Aminicenantes bacterium]
MKSKLIPGLILGVMVFLSAAPAERNATGPSRWQEGELTDEEFSLDGGLFSLNIIRECLGSFQKLTAEAAGKIPPEKLKEIGHTDWEMQTLGFSNHLGIVEGALLKQDLLIKQLQWELVQLRVKAGTAGEKDLLEAQNALDGARQAFEEFKSAFRLKD